MSSAPLDVTELLSADDLALLRTGYDRQAMNDVSSRTLVGRYRASADLVGAIMGHHYINSGLDPRSRELCLIALLAADGGPFTLAVHIYWGLAEGLSPKEVAEVVALTGSYCGVPRLANGLFTLQGTMAVLKKLAANGEPVKSEAVLGAMLQQFPP